MSKATLLRGDCLELMNRIPDGSIDMPRKPQSC